MDPNLCRPGLGPFKPRWRLPAIKVLDSIVSQLNATVVVFNQGLHLDTDTLNASEWEALQNASRRLSAEREVRFVWRTSHVSSVPYKPQAEPSADTAEPCSGGPCKMSMERISVEVSAAARHSFELFAAHNITASLRKDDWFDNNPRQPHVRAPANNRIIAALLRQLYPGLNPSPAGD